MYKKKNETETEKPSLLRRDWFLTFEITSPYNTATAYKFLDKPIVICYFANAISFSTNSNEEYIVFHDSPLSTASVCILCAWIIMWCDEQWVLIKFDASYLQIPFAKISIYFDVNTMFFMQTTDLKAHFHFPNITML